jgi:hypothetical protein
MSPTPHLAHARTRARGAAHGLCTLATFAIVLLAFLTLFAASCARARREGAWVDTTPNGFVAAPVDPPTDASAPDAATRTPPAPATPR